jgi:putative membrane protein
MHNGDWDYGMGGGNFWWMAIMMVAFFGALIWIAVALIQRGNHSPHLQVPAASPPPTPKQTPQEILAERLARGEIEPDEYRVRLEALHITPRD